MFDPDQFAADCRTALAEDRGGHRAVRGGWPAAECGGWDPEMQTKHLCNVAKAIQDGGVP
jgi:hypothetical protein